MKRFKVQIWHGEISSTFSVVDTAQPLTEQPCIIYSWNNVEEPNACFLAEDFCKRHNGGK